MNNQENFNNEIQPIDGTLMRVNDDAGSRPQPGLVDDLSFNQKVISMLMHFGRCGFQMERQIQEIVKLSSLANYVSQFLEPWRHQTSDAMSLILFNLPQKDVLLSLQSSVRALELDVENMKTVLNDFHGQVLEDKSELNQKLNRIEEFYQEFSVVKTDVDSIKGTCQMMSEILNSFTSGNQDSGVNFEGEKEVTIEPPLIKTKKRITLYNVGTNCYALAELTKRYMVIGEFDGRVIVKPRLRTRKRKRN